MKRRIFYTISILFSLISACSPVDEPENSKPDSENGNETGVTMSVVSINSERPGNEDEILLPAWELGQTIQVGVNQSKPLSKIDGTKAEFEFSQDITRPFNVLLPVSAYVDETHIRIEPENPVVPFAGYVGKGQPVWLNPVCGGLRIPMKGGYVDSDKHYTLKNIEIRGNRGEQMSGVFALDYNSLQLTSAEDTDESKVISSDMSVDLSSLSEREIEVIMPAGYYESGLTIRFTATDDTHYDYVTKSAFVVTAGMYTELPLVWYRPGEVQGMITGYVRSTSGEAIAGVVVSDGLNAAKTDRDGRYTLPWDQDEYAPKFVFVSTPREYSAPVVGGLPVFYKSWEQCKTLESVDFELEPNPSPDHYTLFMAADPQIRKKSWGSDKVAYHSIDAMDDLFRDLREYSSTLAGRKCYGMVLGDIVHEDMTLFPTHMAACATLNFPMYSVIGNHDHHTTAKGEDAQHEPFERHLGPRNYSVNLGKFHVISLDNFLLNPDNIRELDAYGLSDSDMEWLRNDLLYVSEDTQLIVCSHCTMFVKSSGNDTSDSAPNGRNYADLLSRYAKVYNFAGHAHASFNYVYARESGLSNVEVHILARSGGILWLNEYMANGGTPRGYLVCDVDGENIKWKWKVIPYLSGENQMSPVPSYTYRLWSYNNGVAYIGNELMKESYQITPYDRDAYPDGKVYASIYMWDELWGDPYLKVDGGVTYKMERVPRNDPYEYDAAEKEVMDHYNKYHDGFKNYGADVFRTARYVFRADPVEKHGTGVISVTDRFNQTFTVPISW